MNLFTVPSKEQVTPENQIALENLEDNIGFTPNLYAYIAKNDTALIDYLELQNRDTTLSKKEKEVINLVVSQFNECNYCLSAHTLIAGLNGFDKNQILELRSGNAQFDKKLNALAQFTLATVSNRGRVNPDSKDAFFNAGYTESNLIDIVMLIGDKMISNYIHNLAGFNIDFPLAERLERKAA